jgi:hypothetical protein
VYITRSFVKILYYTLQLPMLNVYAPL